MDTGFHTMTLVDSMPTFQELSEGVEWEKTGKGRLGNHLVKKEEKAIPLVRTTSRYTIPMHEFSSTHQTIAAQIQMTFASENKVSFNNALIEIYDRTYTKMGYHSDQCLDIEKGSYIALFSCYERPEELCIQSTRKLKVKNKETEEEFEIPLTHNSVVLFSTKTNEEFLHKIVLEEVRGMKPLKTDNKWLGITFRTSKTFLQFKEGKPYFSNGKELILANDEEQKKFYQLRGEENRNVDFRYPELPFTLSSADLLPPKL